MVTELVNGSTEAIVDRSAVGDTRLLVAHLDAAHRLARSLLRNKAEADDVVQEAFVRACEHFHTFHGGDGRSWLLTIVRNCCYDNLKKSANSTHVEFDDETRHVQDSERNPQSSLLRQEQLSRLVNAISGLPAHLCEVLVFREFEEMSYRDIATFVGIPIGTVMSRLNRARQLLRRLVSKEAKEGDAL